MEKLVEQYLNKCVKGCDGMSIKLNSPIGIPDRLVLLPGGLIFFVELKSEGKKPRSIQLKRHRQLKQLGFHVYVMDSKKQIEEVLKSELSAT